MFKSKNNNSVIVKKQKQYTANDWETTGYGPSLCIMADKKRFYTPNHDEVESNYNPNNELDFIISYQNKYNLDNAFYDVHYTRNLTYNNYITESFSENHQKFKWDFIKDKYILNIENNNSVPEFENVDIDNNGYVATYFGNVYENIGNPVIVSSQSVPYINASSGTSCTTKITNTGYDYFPANLGCAVLFSATSIPSQFAVGVKGGTGGSMYNFNGKLYNSNDTEHIKSLGNNLYLFYDTVIDYLNFRTSILAKTENTLMFTPPVFADGIYHKLYSNGVNVATSQSKGTFSNFGFVSIKTFVQCAAPNLDSCIRVKPSNATLSFRYNTASVSSYVKNGEKRAFHSNIPYSSHSQFGYAGFAGWSNVEEVISWGDVKYITEMNGTFDGSSLTAIPSYWGNWENLSSTEYMFGAANFKKIPNSWQGLNNVTNATGMFECCGQLTAIPDSWDGLNNLVSASTMFLQCYELTGIPNSWAGLENVTSTTNMFLQCYKLSAIPNTWAGLTKLKHADDMFTQCSSLTSIPSDLLSKTKLKETDSTWQRMFWGCDKLKCDIEPILRDVCTGTYANPNMYGSAFKGCTGVSAGTSSYSMLTADTGPSGNYYRIIFGV